MRQQTPLGSFLHVLLLVVFLPYLLGFSKVLSFRLYPVFSLDNLIHFNDYSETLSSCQQLPDLHTYNLDLGVPPPPEQHSESPVWDAIPSAGSLPA